MATKLQIAAFRIVLQELFSRQLPEVVTVMKVDPAHFEETFEEAYQLWKKEWK